MSDKRVVTQWNFLSQEYTNGDRYIQNQQFKTEGSEVSSNHGPEKRYTCSAAAHRLPFTRRPVTRVIIEISMLWILKNHGKILVEFKHPLGSAVLGKRTGLSEPRGGRNGGAVSNGRAGRMTQDAPKIRIERRHCGTIISKTVSFN